MAISFDRFSDAADQARNLDRDLVVVNSRRNVRMRNSRFRLVRWIDDSGFGRHRTNRRTVDSFIDSLKDRYGGKVTSQLRLDDLRELQATGKPLNMRVVRTVIREADETADAVKLVESSKIERLIDREIDRSAYLTLAGGRAVADEVHGRTDVQGTIDQFGALQTSRAEKGQLSGDLSLFTAKRWAKMAVTDAHHDLFLTGYGIGTRLSKQYREEMVPERVSMTRSSEPYLKQYEKLQAIFDENPRARALHEKYGVRFDASRLSPALYTVVTDKLRTTTHEALDNPERLPGDGPVKERIEQAVRRKAERVVDDFVRERAEALDRLHGPPGDGESGPEGMPPLTADERRGLTDVLAHRRIPPAAVPKLCALRSLVPAELRPLTGIGCAMEDTIDVLNRIGVALDEASSALADNDYRDFVGGEENRQSFLQDCGCLLLDGKWSYELDSDLRHAVRTSAPGSHFLELCKGIAGMRGEMHRSPTQRSDWSWARVSLDRMAEGVVALLGRDAPPMMAEYTPRDANVLDAMRNCGIYMPPPTVNEVVHSGRRSFTRPALEVAREELASNLAKRLEPSDRYPDFPGEAVVDLDRADFVVGGRRLERGDADAIVESIRDFCVDGKGNRDDRLLNIVAQLVFQRSNSLAHRRFATGADLREADRESKLKSAPIHRAAHRQVLFHLQRQQDGRGRGASRRQAGRRSAFAGLHRRECVDGSGLERVETRARGRHGYRHSGLLHEPDGHDLRLQSVSDGRAGVVARDRAASRAAPNDRPPENRETSASGAKRLRCERLGELPRGRGAAQVDLGAGMAHRGVDPRVPEQLADGGEVHVGLEQLDGRGMAQGVGL